MSKKDFLNELKLLWLTDKKTRKDILKMFSWISLWDESDEEMKKNQQKVFEILMRDDSVIRNFLMEKIWLSDDTISLLNQYLSWKEFYDLKLLFESLKDFFTNHYKTIEFVAYRLNETKNSLEFFAWKDSLATNISLWEIFNSDFKNEVEALNANKIKFFSILDNNYYQEQIFWWVASIKIKTQNDIFIFSFYAKEMEDFEEHDLKNDILKIKKLFTKYWLISILDNIIKYIDAKYKDELTWIFNRAFISALPRHIKYSVLFIDLDNFKTINDSYWHQSWDEVLKWVSLILKDSVRPRDKVCRISWDEFAILVPTNSSWELDAIERRIRKWFSEKKFNFKNKSTWIKDEIEISATIWKALASSKKTLDQIISEADLEMLWWKKAEWNVYRIFSSMNSLQKEDQIKVLWMWICDVRCNLECQHTNKKPT